MDIFKSILCLIFALQSIGCEESHNPSANQVTEIIEDLLRDYNKEVLPTKDGEVLNITIQMYISDMVPVEPLQLHYSMDIYFRQFWKDFRLDYRNKKDSHDFDNDTDSNHSLTTMALSEEFSNDIWIPDIFFPLSKKELIHTVTRPNKLVRLQPDGTILYSQRVGVTVYCNMNLSNFPFDKQRCTFPMESYGYSNKHVRLDWNYARNGPVYPPKEKTMLEFTYDRFTIEKSEMNYGITGKFDQLNIHFYFSRNVDYYLLQMYLPIILVVILSWVGFWIDYKSTPARVSLGITTVLTMATLGNSIRASIPSVDYSKSIDWYLLMCSFYVFAAMVEYAIVGITDMKWKETFKQKVLSNSTTKSTIKRKITNVIMRNKSQPTHSPQISTATSYTNVSFDDEHTSNGLPPESFPLRSRNSSDELTVPINSTRPSPTMMNSIGELDFQKQKTRDESVKRRTKEKSVHKTKERVVKKMLKKQPENQEIHVIDGLSRYVFPITFLICNITYFTVCVLNE